MRKQNDGGTEYGRIPRVSHRKIINRGGTSRIELYPEYRKGLAGLTGFSHVQVLWWMDGCDNERDRSILTEEKPYRNGPDVMGVFALRSPERPNPIAVSAVGVLRADIEAGVLEPDWIDARDGSPVLDIKPYTPASDRIAQPSVPAWCAGWPNSYEESVGFDWKREFRF